MHKLTGGARSLRSLCSHDLECLQKVLRTRLSSFTVKSFEIRRPSSTLPNSSRVASTRIRKSPKSQKSRRPSDHLEVMPSPTCLRTLHPHNPGNKRDLHHDGSRRCPADPRQAVR